LDSLQEVSRIVVEGAAAGGGGAAVASAGGGGTAAAVPFCSTALPLKMSWVFSALGLMEKTMPLPQ
jgi:hypothetical protein